ncbi:MAG TPA: chemotaxis protein CheD [Candidatus Angelobacter sp.]
MSTTIKMPSTLEAGNMVSQLPLREIYLHPGQMHVSNQPAQISMILGSCAGVCVYDRLRAMGGATHYMLPEWDGSGQPSPRYGDVAIDALLKQFQAYGSKPGDLEARIFGGACMFEVFRGNEGVNDHIGARNVNLAVEILSRLGIAIVAKDTGGENGRKLKMQSDTGMVLVSLIRNS